MIARAPASLRYVIGDATAPATPGVIAHICNDANAWGAGFSGAVSRRWGMPEFQFRGHRHDLGDVQIVDVGNGIRVANMVAQHGVGPDAIGRPPIRYHALRRCLVALAKTRPARVHMPRIGCGLAGGHWDEVEAIIVDTLVRADVDVTVYDLPLGGAS